VSRLLLETRDGAEAEGTRIEFAGGKLVNVSLPACPQAPPSASPIFFTRSPLAENS